MLCYFKGRLILRQERNHLEGGWDMQLFSLLTTHTPLLIPHHVRQYICSTYYFEGRLILRLERNHLLLAGGREISNSFTAYNARNFARLTTIFKEMVSGQKVAVPQGSKGGIMYVNVAYLFNFMKGIRDRQSWRHNGKNKWKRVMKFFIYYRKETISISSK